MERFIIEAIPEENYLDTNPHPEYRLVQVTSGQEVAEFSEEKPYLLYIWELK